MIEYLVRERMITVLFFIMITVLGILSFFQLPKQEQPEIIVNMATVTTVYPGASPEKVEQTITNKLEEKINELQGLKSITSTSALGVSSIVVEAENGVDFKAKWEELRKKVKDAEANLPAEAHQPIINDDVNRTFIQTFNVYADSVEQLYSVRGLLQDWKDQLRTIPKVADVTIDGLPDKQVTVEIDTQKLQQYGLHWGMVWNAIQKENEKTPLGDYQVGNRTFQLRMDEVQSVDDFANTLISQSREGYPVYLKDIGTVKMTTERIKEYYYHNGKPAVSISLNAEFGSDVPSLQAKVDEMMAFLVKDKPTWLKVESIHTQNERVNQLFGDLTKEMIIAIAAVIFVCTLGLNMITSFVVALAIPISIAVGLILLPSIGVSLNQISIVGLIIVLGILVDDAVVVNDNIERRLSVLGEKPFEAAVRGSKEVSISIVTATLATIASFGPLFFLEGNAGQFIKAIPIIITLSMLASMVMSLTIIPIFREWHEARRPSSPDSYRKPAGLLGKQIQALTEWYANKLLKGLLKKPILTGVAGILIGTSAYGLMPLIPVELFPMANRPEMYVNVTAPTGSNIKETDALVRRVSDWLQEQPEVLLVASYAGNSAPKMFGGDTGNGSGERVGQVILKVDHKKHRTTELVERWNEELKWAFPGGSVIVKELEAGPPVGAPVVIRIYGEDIGKLRELSQTVKDTVVKVGGTKDIQDSFGAERNTLQFRLNKEVMDELMVNPNDVSKAIRLVSEGIKITEFDDGDELVEMILRMKQEEEDEDPSTVFQRITIPNALGQQIQLSQIAVVEPDFALGSISHRNLSRVVTILSDVQGRTATEVMNEIKPQLSEMDWPEGYRFEVGGETSEQTEIFLDMGKLSVIAVFLILILIAMQFYSLSIPLLVMSTIYLAFAGSLIGLFVTQTPLGFMTMMGVISLAGIVVRNGIVLVEFIEEARREGVPLLDAVVHAGEARFRPILLTSATAISGLTPLAVIGDVLFRPLAITIIFGLAFSTLLTLIIVPSLYVVMSKRKLKRQAKKRQEVADSVEIGL